MNSAAERKLSEAEIRRRALRVYDGRLDEERQTEVKRAERERTRELMKSRMQLLFCICLGFGLIMGYMVLNTQVTVVGHNINVQEQVNEELQTENTRLLLQIEQETSPDKVANFAAEHFNMVSPTEDKVIYYSKNDWESTSAKEVRTGMAVDSQSLGSGSVVVVEEDNSSSLLQRLAALWGQISGGNAVTVGMNEIGS